MTIAEAKIFERIAETLERTTLASQAIQKLWEREDARSAEGHEIALEALRAERDAALEQAKAWRAQHDLTVETERRWAERGDSLLGGTKP